MNKKKQLTQLMGNTFLDDSFVLGYYGGGNYGDELLLEVLQHMFHTRGYRTISFLYQKPASISKFHRDLGYEAVDAGNKLSVLRAVVKRKNLVIGGGGLWGLDVNSNVVLMSFLLFFARWVLRKRVYLLGVGYYDSTSSMGHFGAWLAGKSAHQILARDDESYKNFSAINRHTYLSDDIAYMLPAVKQDISRELTVFNDAVSLGSEKTVMISVRRFKQDQVNPYVDTIKTWLATHSEVPVILALMEPREVDPRGFALLKSLQKNRDNAIVIDFDYNPMVLYHFFARHKKTLSYIGPQFHVQLVAHLAGVKLLPVFYDNKVSELLRLLHYDRPIAIRDISVSDINSFLAERSEA